MAAFGNIAYDRMFSVADTIKHVSTRRIHSAVGEPGVAAGEDGQPSEPLQILTGHAGDSDTGTAGTAGTLALQAGDGGSALKNNAVAGDGGAVTLTAGAGGSALNTPGGGGGHVALQAGPGGMAVAGGAGGSVRITAGPGAANHGPGGHVLIQAGAGHGQGPAGYVHLSGGPVLGDFREHTVVTGTTVTADALIKGILVWSGPAPVTLTLPTRTDLTNVLHPLPAGAGFDVYVLNNSVDHALTMQAADGGAWYGTVDVPPTMTAHLYIRCPGTGGAYTVYRLG